MSIITAIIALEDIFALGFIGCMTKCSALTPIWILLFLLYTQIRSFYYLIYFKTELAKLINPAKCRTPHFIKLNSFEHKTLYFYPVKYYASQDQYSCHSIYIHGVRGLVYS
ncbi:MAG: hypothetical protein IT267_02325 [Saprospiraceae bacterium]|nr:hypothetical protein [Saprospiraceae bacterium]